MKEIAKLMTIVAQILAFFVLLCEASSSEMEMSASFWGVKLLAFLIIGACALIQKHYLDMWKD